MIIIDNIKNIPVFVYLDKPNFDFDIDEILDFKQELLDLISKNDVFNIAITNKNFLYSNLPFDFQCFWGILDKNYFEPKEYSSKFLFDKDYVINFYEYVSTKLQSDLFSNYLIIKNDIFFNVNTFEFDFNIVNVNNGNSYNMNNLNDFFTDVSNLINFDVNEIFTNSFKTYNTLKNKFINLGQETNNNSHFIPEISIEEDEEEIPF